MEVAPTPDCDAGPPVHQAAPVAHGAHLPGNMRLGRPAGGCRRRHDGRPRTPRSAQVTPPKEARTRVPIALVLAAACGTALGACAAAERARPPPEVVAAAPDAVAVGPPQGAARRLYCRPQPWCRWGRLRGPSY